MVKTYPSIDPHSDPPNIYAYKCLIKYHRVRDVITHALSRLLSGILLLDYYIHSELNHGTLCVCARIDACW